MGQPTVIPLWFGGVTGVSNAVDLSTVTAVVGLIMPDQWTEAAVTVEASADGQTFRTMYEGRNRTLMSFNVPPGMFIALNPNQLRGCKAIRLISGTRSSLVPQGDPREFGLVVEMGAP